ncbi:MAG: hypothetical protein ACREHD_06055, partial [Pirellulales bacterium]
NPMQFNLKWVLASPLVVGLLVWTLSPRGYSLYWIIALRSVFFLLAVPILLMIVEGGRRSRAFGLGALCPAIVGVALAAQPLFYAPKPGYLRGLMVLAARKLSDGSPLADLQFSLGFLLTLGLVCGTAGVLLSWLVGQKKP